MRHRKEKLIMGAMISFLLIVSVIFFASPQKKSKHNLAAFVNTDISLVTDTGSHSLNISTGQINSNFVVAGSAFSYGTDGTYSLTQSGAGGANGQQGYTVFKNQIDMTRNWSMTFNLSLQTVTSSIGGVGGDFVGLILTPATQTRLQQQTNQSITGMNTAASNLGIASLPSTTIWGLDFYNNSKAQYSIYNTVPTNPLDPAYSGDWWNFGNTKNFLETVAGFRHTYGTGSPYTGRLVNSFGANDDGPHRVITSFASPVQVTYTYGGAQNGTVRVTTGDGQTYTQVLSSTSDPATNQWQPVMSVGATAATGGYKSNMGVQITNFNLQLATALVSVTYKDSSGNVLKPARNQAILANIGDTISAGSAADATKAKYVYQATRIPGYVYQSSNVLTVVGDNTQNNVNLVYNKSFQKSTLKVANPTILPANDPWRTTPQIVVSGPHTNDNFFTGSVDTTNIFATSDNSATTNKLMRPGYSYTVTYRHAGDPNDGVIYPSLAAALTANPKYDDTDNQGSTDSNEQIFEVNYQVKGRTTLRAVPNFDFGVNAVNTDDTYSLANTVQNGASSVNYLNLDYSNDYTSTGYPIGKYLQTGVTKTPVKRELVVTSATGNPQNVWHLEGQLGSFYNNAGGLINNTGIQLKLNSNKLAGINDYPLTSSSMWQTGGTPLTSNGTLVAGGPSVSILNSNNSSNNNAVGSWRLSFGSANDATLQVPRSVLAKLPKTSSSVGLHAAVTWTLVTGAP
ncbi:lectin-like domain-containing protein [Xylocopilactobacillus apicola]|uniref:WxL domain-containing protein n=1 Tax=Xylocopilactobacillus apicola TaxID=2932184 RepID=A0AAU9D9J6_9LACO|nr:hypothetical protein [Xylocopilactobacillus apicola]BDR59030.1 hypothetical protein XA3_14710 [Xylocopilactobacillus apicola]